MQRIRFGAMCGLLVCWASFVHAQSPMRDLIRTKAAEVGTSITTANYDKLADTTYPKVVEMAGGREGLISYTKNGMAQVQASGYKFDAIEIGTPGEPVPSGDKLFSIVPDVVRVTGPKTKLEQPCFLLAISNDKGKSWTFIDGTGLTDTLLNQLFPDFPKSLKLPVKPAPKVTPTS